MSEEEQRPLPPRYGQARIFSTGLIVGGVLLGILIIWVGHLVVVTAETTSEATRQAFKTYVILSGLGGMISSGALFGGGILNKNIDKFVRLGMLIAAGLIVVEMVQLLPYFGYYG